jgi:NAD(P)-dependent dehydrogenase (short-subunit alcohol dehydrogenase family)
LLAIFWSVATADKPSRVVHISSWLGSITTKTSGGNYGYCPSKATLNNLARAMAFDLLPRGIVSVVVNPDWVQTDMGGARARLTPEASVAGVVAVADGLTPADAGRFLQWDRAALAW